MADNIAASYRALGLRIGATPDEVKHAYRDLIKIWHPDRFPANPELRAQAHARTAELIAAYACVQEHLRHKAIAHLEFDQHNRQPSPPPAYTAARMEPPLHSDIRSDGSRRDYSSSRLIRCRRCGHKNVFPRDTRVLQCRRCGGDPTQHPYAATRHAMRPPQVPVAPGSRKPHETLGWVARMAGALGASVYPLVTGLWAMASMPGIESRPGQRIAVGSSALVLVVGAAATLIALGAGERLCHRVRMGLTSFALAFGPMAVGIGLGIASGWLLALLVPGLAAMMITLRKGNPRSQAMVTGLSPCVLAAGCAAMVSAALAHGHPHPGTTLALSLLVIVAGVAAIVIRAGAEGHAERGLTLGLAVLTGILGFAALMFMLGGRDRPFADHAVAPAGWVLACGGVVVAMAGAAMSGFMRTGVHRERKVAIDALALGMVSMAAGAATLMWCR